jgi:hypothetical protein
VLHVDEHEIQPGTGERAGILERTIVAEDAEGRLAFSQQFDCTVEASRGFGGRLRMNWNQNRSGAEIMYE